MFITHGVGGDLATIMHAAERTIRSRSHRRTGHDTPRLLIDATQFGLRVSVVSDLVGFEARVDGQFREHSEPFAVVVEPETAHVITNARARAALRSCDVVAFTFDDESGVLDMACIHTVTGKGKMGLTKHLEVLGTSERAQLEARRGDRDTVAAFAGDARGIKAEHVIDPRGMSEALALLDPDEDARLSWTLLPRILVATQQLRYGSDLAVAHMPRTMTR